MSVITSPAVPELADGLPDPRRLFAFLTLSLGIVMGVLDTSIVNVSLPSIARELNATAAQVIWVASSYQLAVVVALLPVAALGEAIGFRKVFVGGLILFTAASLGCALATSEFTLVLARIVQGLGAAGIVSLGAGLVRFIVPASRLGKGLATITMVIAVTSVAGPSVATAILSIANWHWLFLVNVPLGIICVFAGRVTLPLTPASGTRVDIVSVALNVVTFGPLISGLISIGNKDLPWWLPGGQLVVAALGASLLIRRQRGQKAPLFPVDLLGISQFRLAVLASMASFVAQMLATVSLPFFFVHEMGFQVVTTGLLMTAWPIATAIVSPLVGRLADRASPIRLTVIGGLVFAAGLLSVGLLSAQPAPSDIVWRLFLCGIGYAVFQSPNSKMIMSSTPRVRTGGASGMLVTARNLGQAIGTATAAVIFGQVVGYNLLLTMGVAAAFAVVSAALCLRHAPASPVQ